MTQTKYGRARCDHCGQDGVARTASGGLRKHYHADASGAVCPGPAPDMPLPGETHTVTNQYGIRTHAGWEASCQVCHPLAVLHWVDEVPHRGPTRDCTAPECTPDAVHVHRYTWGDDGVGNSGSFCRCGKEEPSMPLDRNVRPAVTAAYEGECTECFGSISVGDQIRSDGDGGWECAQHAEGDRPEPEATPPVNGVQRAAEAFLGMVVSQTPARSATDPDAAQRAAEDFMSSASKVDKPKDQTNRYGYLITDPETGMFRRFKNGNIHGWTRCTTFVKATSNTKALGDWRQRNTLIGAAKRPDLAMRAHGLTHEEHKAELDRIVDQLDEIAGAKVASGHGTEIHNAFEGIANGLMTLDDVDPKWRGLTELYLAKMAAYGLEPCPGLVEQTTMTHQYGGVAGRFDEIRYHRPSGTYIMCDTKSGRHVENYGKNEVPAQLSIYVDGFNQYGIYDWPEEPSDPDAEWGPGTWRRPVDADGNRIHVRTDWGAVIHTPIQGEDAYTVTLKFIPLAWGREVAAECARVRAMSSGVPKWLTPGAAEATALLTHPSQWEIRFSAVTTKEEASALWHDAKAAGVDGVELGRLVGLAQRALLARG